MSEHDELMKVLVQHIKAIPGEGDPIDDSVYIAQELAYVAQLAGVAKESLAVAYDTVEGVAASMSLSLDTDRLLQEANRIYASQLGIEMPKQMRDVIRENTKKIFNETRKPITEVALSLVDKKALEYLRSSDNFYIGKIFKDYAPEIRDALEKSIEKGIGAVQIAKKMRELVGDVVSAKFYRYAVVARTSANRLRNWSRVLAYEAELVTEVEFIAMMDERTSEICQNMDGAVFSVSSLVSHVKEVQDAGEDRLPEVSPFPSLQDVLDEAGNRLPESEIEKAGFAVPPLHCNCRSVLVYYDPVVARINNDSELVGGMKSAHEDRKGTKPDNPIHDFGDPKNYARFSSSEIRSIYEYTDKGYSDVNYYLRNMKPQADSLSVDEMKKRIGNMFTALEKINPANTPVVSRRLYGSVMGGIDVIEKDFAKDVVMQGFSSATTNYIDIAKNADDLFVMHIKPRTGKPIQYLSKFKKENEVIFNPGTALRFLSKEVKHRMVNGKKYKRIIAYYEEY